MILCSLKTYQQYHVTTHKNFSYHETNPNEDITEYIYIFQPQPTPRIDFDDRYYLPMHDHYTGAITALEFSGDGK